jgi:hypothetical protein
MSEDPSQTSNPIMEILTTTNKGGLSRGYIPTDTCQAATSSQVSCTPQVHNADSVTFLTFESLPALYSAYLDSVQRLSGKRPSMEETAVGDCNSKNSEGEVSWNHMYEHPRNFTIAQLQTGRFEADVAGGRLFCTIIEGREHIVWTSNDIKMLGEVIGYGGHAETFTWWKRVHHNMGPAPMSGEHSSSPSMSMPEEPSSPPSESMSDGM